MKKKRKLSVLLLICVLVAVLVGCSKEKASEKKVSVVDEITKSKKIDLGETYEEIQAVQKLTDGNIRVGVSDRNGANSRIFESSDKGKSWKKMAELNESIKATEADFVQFWLGGNGEIFIKVVKDAASYEETLDKESHYYPKLADSEAKEVAVELEKVEETAEEHKNHRNELEHVGINSLVNVAFTSDGDIVALDLAGSGYLLESQTGKVKRRYQMTEEAEYAESLYADEENVYFSSAMGFWVYEKESGRLVTDSELGKAVSKKLEEAQNYNFGPSIDQGEKPDQVYFTNALGAFSYDKGTKKVKQLVDLTKSDLNLTLDHFRLLTIFDDTSYLTVSSTMEMDEQSQSQSLYLSTNYTGKAAAKQQAKIKTLTIWTLQDTMELPALIDRFKKQHPDVAVEVQVGIDKDSAQTVSDAISSLNTKMLAGEGPDVILADGLSVATYIEKGMLVNLDDLYQELIKKGQLFEKVATTYQTKDGLFAIPQGFSSMVVTAKKGMAEQVKSAAELLAYLKKDNVGVAVNDAKSLTSLLYYSSLNQWFDGKTVDKEKLKQFFETYKPLLEKLAPYEPEKIDFTQQADDFKSGNFNWLTEEMDGKKSEVALDHLSLAYMIHNINSLSQLGYETLPFNSQSKQFIPQGVLSVSNSAKNQEIAKEFIAFSLSQEAASFIGTPVNKQAFEEEFKASSKYRAEGSNPLTDEDYQQIVNSLEDLDTAVNLNGVISETIMEQLEAYVFKGEDIDTAVNNAAKKIDLYMSE